jgi:hypothetical protein
MMTNNPAYHVSTIAPGATATRSHTMIALSSLPPCAAPTARSTSYTTRSSVRIFWRMPMRSAARSNRDVPGVDSQYLAGIEAYGVERWLAELGAVQIANYTKIKDPAECGAAICGASPLCRRSAASLRPKVRFAPDSSLERAGFEPSVPLRLEARRQIPGLQATSLRGRPCAHMGKSESRYQALVAVR